MVSEFIRAGDFVINPSFVEFVDLSTPNVASISFASGRGEYVSCVPCNGAYVLSEDEYVEFLRELIGNKDGIT